MGTDVCTFIVMGRSVKPSNYRRCICGRVCKGLSALQTHGRACEMQQVKSALTVYCASESLPQMGDDFIMQNFSQLRAALADLPYGHPAHGMVP